MDIVDSEESDQAKRKINVFKGHFKGEHKFE